jgi:putative addiction module component (TIGR02574 family)
MTTKALLKKALELDIDQRTVLGHQILMSVENECKETGISEEIKKELDRRIAYAEAHPDEWMTLEEFKKRPRKRRRV